MNVARRMRVVTAPLEKIRVDFPTHKNNKIPTKNSIGDGQSRFWTTESARCSDHDDIPHKTLRGKCLVIVGHFILFATYAYVVDANRLTQKSRVRPNNVKDKDSKSAKSMCIGDHLFIRMACSFMKYFTYETNCVILLYLSRCSY